MNTYRAELHIHTVLSPCAGVEMIPPLIIQTALDLDINILAITDHNSTRNAHACIKAAEGTGIHILPGMELQTKEEVHSLCLFDSLQQADQFQQIINQHLPPLNNNVEVFGEQFLVDETGDWLGNEEQLLLTSADLSINEACKIVTGLGGLFIPAHVDRQTNGLIYHLGFVPPEVSTPVVEISRHISPEAARIKYPQLKSFEFIQDGDVHYLDGFLGVNAFTIEKPGINEFLLALSASAGRKLEIMPMH